MTGINAVCWLIDDWTLEISYDKLCVSTDNIFRTMPRAWRTPLAIQLGYTPHSCDYDGRPVPNCPMFQYGLSNYGDQAIIFTPRGTNWLLHYANNLAWRRPGTKLDPLLVLVEIHRAPAKIGFFGIRKGLHPYGLTRSCSDTTLAESLDYPGYTDHCVSRHLLY